MNSFDSNICNHDNSLFISAGCMEAIKNGGIDKTALPETKLTRHFDRNPFVPKDAGEINARANDILMIQAMGLKRRMEHIGAKTAVLGISGGLDSSLALLVCAKACDLMGLNRKTVYAITMPCFGTNQE